MNRNLGIQTVKLNDQQLGDFYSFPNDNSTILCTPNQYIVIESLQGESIGPFYWTGEKFVEVQYREINSSYMDKIKPKNRDPYQMAYIDSLYRNQLTFATGPAGSGKSIIAIAFAMQELEMGRASQIVVFCNPYVAKSAVKMGFYPGSRDEKLLDTSIGSILKSKLGGAHGRDALDRLMSSEQLILMPMGDARGYEVPEEAFVYFSEAQNTDRYLMQLFLQRTNDTCKICVEGDERQQDSTNFHNGLNGLSRAIEVFNGESYAGHVQLRNIYRGKIAQKAEEICD